MGRRKYIKGALVEARNSKYGKGFGMIISNAVKKSTTMHGYSTYGNGIEYFDVQWFECPGNVDRWTFKHYGGRLNMTKNQIKVIKQR